MEMVVDHICLIQPIDEVIEHVLVFLVYVESLEEFILALATVEFLLLEVVHANFSAGTGLSY